VGHYAIGKVGRRHCPGRFGTHPDYLGAWRKVSAASPGLLWIQTATWGPFSVSSELFMPPLFLPPQLLLNWWQHLAAASFSSRFWWSPRSEIVFYKPQTRGSTAGSPRSNRGAIARSTLGYHEWIFGTVSTIGRHSWWLSEMRVARHTGISTTAPSHVRSSLPPVSISDQPLWRFVILVFPLARGHRHQFLSFLPAPPLIRGQAAIYYLGRPQLCFIACFFIN